VILLGSDAFPGKGTGMGVGRGEGGTFPPLDFEIISKKGFFSMSMGKKQISPLLDPPGKNFGKIPYCPPWKKSFRRPWERAIFSRLSH